MSLEKKPVKPMPFSVVNVLTSPFEKEFAYTANPPVGITLSHLESYVVICSLSESGRFHKILSERNVSLFEIEEVRSHADTTPHDNEIFMAVQLKKRHDELACA